MKLIMVRHGETEWNRLRKLQSRIDLPLNINGFNEAKKARDFLKKEKLHIIFTSPLIRAKQTAKIINEYHNKSIIERNELIERDFGRFEGTDYFLFKKKFMLISNKELVENYGVESFENVRLRAENFFKFLLENYFNKTILVVSHSSFLKTLISLILNEPFGKISKINKKNASISIIKFETPSKIAHKRIAIDEHLTND